MQTRDRILSDLTGAAFGALKVLKECADGFKGRMDKGVCEPQRTGSTEKKQEEILERLDRLERECAQHFQKPKKKKTTQDKNEK
ncbi:MAG: hypothetical protein HON43_03340 [Alphaproteobacteria bacterium]|jgi:hypothetical protein|nr:hypothetical protein [Alphaproteobacteria bacterium]MBT5389811.1 hypothetical protein [Alphaproteobacteria bacterium]MBT5540223.1 hypothetical protein [Alphaproteobacteria bacterium]